MLLLYLVPPVLLLLSPVATPFLIMFGIAGPALGATYLFRKVFAKFEPETEAITSDMDFKVDMEGVETEEEAADSQNPESEVPDSAEE